MVAFFGTASAGAAAVGQAGETRATARVGPVIEGGTRGRVGVVFTTREGHRIDTEYGCGTKRCRPIGVREGDEVEILYEPDDPKDVAPYQNLTRLWMWALIAFSAVASAVLGTLAYRTRRSA